MIFPAFTIIDYKLLFFTYISELPNISILSTYLAAAKLDSLTFVKTNCFVALKRNALIFCFYSNCFTI